MMFKKWRLQWKAASKNSCMNQVAAPIDVPFLTLSWFSETWVLPIVDTFQVSRHFPQFPHGFMGESE